MASLKLALAGLLVTMTLSACGGSSKSDEPAAREETSSYAVSVWDPTGNSYSGNYIKIHGTRDGLADLKYPCESEFDRCLPISAGGVVEQIDDLCPTENTLAPGATGTGTWDFTYELYSNSTCSAPAMTNLLCENTLDETLGTGVTTNNVLCTTDNGAKQVNLCIRDPSTGAQIGVCPAP